MTTRTALRMAIVGLATAAFGAGLAAPSQAADPAGARDIDWSNATLEMIKGDARCPGGPVKFVNGFAEVDTGATRPSTYVQGSVEFGDVDRDGREDAVLMATCHPLGNTRLKVPAVYAFGVENGAPKQIGVVTTPIVYPESYSVSGDTVGVKARPFDSPEAQLVSFKLRWDGQAFTERTGKEAYLYEWGSSRLAIPFKAEQVKLRPRSDGQPDRPCPKATVDFDNHGGFTASGSTSARTASSTASTRMISATSTATAAPMSSSTDLHGQRRHDHLQQMVLPLHRQERQAGTAELPHGQLLAARLHRHPRREAQLGQGELGQYAGTWDVSVDRTFRWTGHGLKAENPLPGFPKVDVAP